MTGFNKLMNLVSYPQIERIDVQVTMLDTTRVNIFFKDDDGWSRIGEWTTRDGEEVYALVRDEVNRLMIPGLKI
jgi:hypothetical protein